MSGGILLAWLVMFLRLLVTLAIVNRSLIASISDSAHRHGHCHERFCDLALSRRPEGRRRVGRKEEVPIKNPFSLTAAIKFGALFAVILLVVKIVQTHAPDGGIYVVAALAGSVDVDAITLVARRRRPRGASAGGRPLSQS